MVVGLAFVCLPLHVQLVESASVKKNVEKQADVDKIHSMQNIKYIYWQDGTDWLGYLEEFPDYATQGATFEDLKAHLQDLYLDLTGGQIPGVRQEGELAFA